MRRIKLVYRHSGLNIGYSNVSSAECFILIKLTNTDKDVHKAPALDLAGWFTLCTESGPTSALLPIHKEFLAQNESALLLAFHPSAVSASATTNTNGKLPLTIYETIYETEPTKQDDSMQIDGEGVPGLRFRSIPYTIETDETEMIAVDYVAKGGGNAAAATTSTDAEGTISSEAKERADRKGKRRADEPPEAKKVVNGTTTANILTSEEEDQIASMTTRLNSVRMLQSRLSLLSTYISSLPACNLSDTESEANIEPSHLPHLRNIKALITRLSLLTPHTDTSAPTLSSTTTNPPTAVPTQPQLDPLTHAQQAQTNDVTLSSLLSLLGQDVQGLSELGRKFALVENAKQGKGKKMGGGGGGGLGMGMGFAGYGAAGDESMMI
jgi:COP9 signalosome complex subunit 6